MLRADFDASQITIHSMQEVIVTVLCNIIASLTRAALQLDSDGSVNTVTIHPLPTHPCWFRNLVRFIQHPIIFTIDYNEYNEKHMEWAVTRIKAIGEQQQRE